MKFLNVYFGHVEFPTELNLWSQPLPIPDIKEMYKDCKTPNISSVATPGDTTEAILGSSILANVNVIKTPSFKKELKDKRLIAGLPVSASGIKYT